MKKTLILLTLLAPVWVWAQVYSIASHQISGGGGTSTNGVYQVSGTIGQGVAGGPLTGGNYSLIGGFWGMITTVQTAGLPILSITASGNAVIVSWPATVSCSLQQNPDMGNSAGWTASSYTVSSVLGTNSITVTAPAGNLFFRLTKP